MTGATNLNRAYAEGREEQYKEMMQALSALKGKYKGVRGELLAKVQTELKKLQPSPNLRVVEPVAEQAAPLPSCRVCGRDMKPFGKDGALMCQNGHQR